MTNRIPPSMLLERRAAADEMVLLDVREEGVFARGHLLFATILPLSRLELGIRALVPRRATPIVVMDGGDGLAERAATVLDVGGYRDVTVLEGGVDACHGADMELFMGVNVPSKAFGEFVEIACHTPHVAPGDLKKRLDRGDDVVVLDSRPYDEYRMMNIPHAISCPSQELVYRLGEIAPRPETTVVVNCAGRTRSIIGAQSLINAGVPNPVMALENGTMGWKLQGFAWEHQQARRVAKGTPKTFAAAFVRADRVAARSGVKTIDRATFQNWQEEASRRTLYIFDVRPLDEYITGHIAGALPIEGVQLVQKTDNYVAVWNARIVVTDDDGVRARVTAAWLAQMGFDDVAVLARDADVPRSVTGPYRAEPLFAPSPHDIIQPMNLAEDMRTGAVTVIDLSRSLAFKAGHIPGAWFAIRSRLAANLAWIPLAARIAVTSEDGILAAFAAGELRALSGQPVAVLDGGNKAWAAAQLPFEQGLSNMADAPEDAFWRPYELDSAQESEMQKYLSWEQGLVDQVKRDGSARFRPLTPQAIWK